MNIYANIFWIKITLNPTPVDITDESEFSKSSQNSDKDKWNDDYFFEKSSKNS